MNRRLRRIRGAIGMGLTWAAGWALAGVLIGVASTILPGLPWEPFFELFDAPLPTLAIPGFIGGVFFSVVLGIAGRRRRFSELSLPLFAVWGALGGVLLSLFPAALVALGLASISRPDADLWQLTATIGGPLTLLSAASATGSLMLARMAEDRELTDAGRVEVEPRPTAGQGHDLPGEVHGSLHGHPATRAEAPIPDDPASDRTDG